MKLVNKKINGLEITKAINHTDNDVYIMQVCNVKKDGVFVGLAYCYYVKEFGRRVITYCDSVNKLRASSFLVRQTIKSFNYPNLIPENTSAFTPKYVRRKK